jgi:hypothetical protein
VDLSKVSNWIRALSFYGLPLVEFSSRKLIDSEKMGTLSSNLKAELILWKKTKGLDDPDELEYKYFLDGIGVIQSRSFSSEDMEIPISDSTTLGDFVCTGNPRIKMYYLSRLGSLLENFLSNRQYHLYEAGLFWLLIRSKKFNPLIQKILSDPRFYEKGFRDEFIPSQDAVSRGLVKKWLCYFGLLDEHKLNKPKLVATLLYASTLEINEQFLRRGKWKEYVGDACSYLSNCFSITEASIDFNIFLDYLYTRANYLKGFPSGRGHRGLPSKPNIQILELKSPIQLSNIGPIQSPDLIKAIAFGGSI